MIITITPNPSIDVSYYFDDFKYGEVNRCGTYKKTSGGKGLNVTKVLHTLEANVLATGFLGGYPGEAISSDLTKRRIKHDFIKIDEETRTSIAIQNQKESTEILEKGPFVTVEESDLLIRKLKTISLNANVISISGSLPRGLSIPFMNRLLETLFEKKLVLDVSGDLLRFVVEKSVVKPYAIKPNLDEIKQIIPSFQEINDPKKILRDPIFYEIPFVMISLGSKGAIVKYNNHLYECHVPSIDVVSAVGSGDATVAGIAYGIDQNLSITDTLQLAMTLGVLNALERETGSIDPNKIDTIKKQISIQEVNE